MNQWTLLLEHMYFEACNCPRLGVHVFFAKFAKFHRRKQRKMTANKTSTKKYVSHFFPYPRRDLGWVIMLIVQVKRVTPKIRFSLMTPLLNFNKHSCFRQ